MKIKVQNRVLSIIKNIGPLVVVFLAFKLFIFLYAPPMVHRAELDETIRSGQSVLLEFHASWCSTCLIQRNVLNKLFAEDDLKKIKRYTLNFDLETDLKNQYKVNSQSTLILIKDSAEVRRSIGVVEKDGLRNFLNTN